MANIIVKNVSKKFDIKENSPVVALGISLLVLLMTLLVIAWPFIAIWALNTLFQTTIAYTFKTWIASYILLLSIQGAVRMSNKD